MAQLERREVEHQHPMGAARTVGGVLALHRDHRRGVRQHREIGDPTHLARRGPRGGDGVPFGIDQVELAEMAGHEQVRTRDAHLHGPVGQHDPLGFDRILARIDRKQPRRLPELVDREEASTGSEPQPGEPERFGIREDRARVAELHRIRVHLDRVDRAGVAAEVAEIELRGAGG